MGVTAATASDGRTSNTKHVQTRFKSGGTSLHPLQRTGQVAATGFPSTGVNSGANGINSRAAASQNTGITQPAILLPGSPNPIQTVKQK